MTAKRKELEFKERMAFLGLVSVLPGDTARFSFPGHTTGADKVDLLEALEADIAEVPLLLASAEAHRRIYRYVLQSRLDGRIP